MGSFSNPLEPDRSYYQLNLYLCHTFEYLSPSTPFTLTVDGLREGERQEKKVERERKREPGGTARPERKRPHQPTVGLETINYRANARSVGPSGPTLRDMEREMERERERALDRPIEVPDLCESEGEAQDASNAPTVSDAERESAPVPEEAPVERERERLPLTVEIPEEETEREREAERSVHSPSSSPSPPSMPDPLTPATSQLQSEASDASDAEGIERDQEDERERGVETETSESDIDDGSSEDSTGFTVVQQEDEESRKRAHDLKTRALAVAALLGGDEGQREGEREPEGAVPVDDEPVRKSISVSLEREVVVVQEEDK
ncbi:hypothetical protein KIPB_011642 [Kipferlia bialata]|uniref:Uncharacterized protein n=1 Tax=Kipferlia bialata TaxID=797122 RepID=A0A9K3D6E1_9EUKA|nr:hypothetical protein KIPB_011642 [Kipferlia bialata]|eukprot:g11642.t1